MKALKNTLLWGLVMTCLSLSTYAQIKPNTWYYLESKVNRLHLDVPGHSKKARTEVWMWKNNNSYNQQWMFIPAGHGWYFIKNRNSGLYLDVKMSSKKAGTYIWQYPLNKTNAQKWYLIPTKDGYYHIRSRVSGYYLDVKHSGKTIRTKVWQFPLNYTDAQKWKLKPVIEKKLPVLVPKKEKKPVPPSRNNDIPRSISPAEPGGLTSDDFEQLRGMMDSDGLFKPNAGFPVIMGWHKYEFDDCQNCVEPRVTINKFPKHFLIGDASLMDFPKPDWRTSGARNPKRTQLDGGVSSIYIPKDSRYAVILFEDRGFKGKSVTIQKNESTVFQNYKINASSFLIYHPERGFLTDVVLPVVYENTNWRGKSFMITKRNIPNLHQQSMGDIISSVKIPPKFKLVLYEGVNYTGKSITIDNSMIIQGLDMNNFKMNDKISSLKVIVNK